MKKIILVILTMQVFIFAVTDKEVSLLEEKTSNNSQVRIKPLSFEYTDLSISSKFIKYDLEKRYRGDRNIDFIPENNKITGYIFINNKKIKFFHKDFSITNSQNIMQLACIRKRILYYIIIYSHANYMTAFGQMEYFPYIYIIDKNGIENISNKYKEILNLQPNIISFNLSDSTNRYPYYSREKLIERLIETGFCQKDSFLEMNELSIENKYSLKGIKKNLKQKKELKTYNKEFFQNLLKEKPIEKENLTTYNNIAYYLQKAGSNKEAVYLLEKILKKYPTRTVAHYNLADAYWALGEKKKAIASYTTYIEQMCNAGKEKRIPQVVRDRVSNK